jgi:CheY-like chemotaxis protein
MARILIAEDEPSVREFVNRALFQRGHEVTVTCDGSEALDALQDGTFDLLLADIVMPQLDGVGLALKVAKDFPDLRIVLMTGTRPNATAPTTSTPWSTRWSTSPFP